MYNIMVVEDDYNTRKLMCTVLERNGYLPVPANDGMDALRQLENTHIDLLLLDIMMPNMDGYELTQTLRSKGNMIPILMVTAKQTPADKHRGFLLGTDDYMTKPVDEEEMILRIAALLRRSPSSASASWWWVRPCCFMTRSPSALTGKQPLPQAAWSCRRRNLCSCSSCCPTRTRFSRGAS